jgi:cyclophilin family peptidyl-prolyl cis-trans isomerase
MKLLRSARSLLLGIGLSISLSTAASSFAQELPKVSIKTSEGEIIVELYPEKAPNTVQNFLKVVKSGHYSKTIFHRVIDNFMIQGGGFTTAMKEKPTGKAVDNEAKYAFERGLKNELGTIAMARTNEPHSARAQFYINVQDNPFLDYQELPSGDPVTFTLFGEEKTMPRKLALKAGAGYTPFGKVISGMDVVEKIKVKPTDFDLLSGMANVPTKPILIESIKIIK